MDRILQRRLVAVVRVADGSLVPDALQALVDGGVRVLELTATIPEMLQLIRHARRRFGADVLIGAGSVCDAALAAEAIDAGAQFVVSPITDPAVVELCRGRAVPAVPGALTPTEVYRAHTAGAAMVKIFPAGSFGAGYIKALRGPMPFLRLMPTGGVTLENVGDFLRAGAAAVGVGSELLPASLLAERDFAAITNLAQRFVSAVQRFGGRDS